MNFLSTMTDSGQGVDVVVVGAGHAGLSVSCLLKQQGIDHVVLERGEIANAWKKQRWDSLRLLTPNWQTRLPGADYAGSSPNSFMHVPELAQFLEKYAADQKLPVLTNSRVESVTREGDLYRVQTPTSGWITKTVVIASGAFNKPSIPRFAMQLPSSIKQFSAFDYKSPASLNPGGALIVGASATGMQLADEIVRNGKTVTLAVGEHVRMPRYYRGRDIFYWLSKSGIHDQRFDEIDDIDRGRSLPSPQLTGSLDARFLDINALSALGVRIVGKLSAIRDNTLHFSGSLKNVCKLADLKMFRLLREIDVCADRDGAPPTKEIKATTVADPRLLSIDLSNSDIANVIWATGFQPDYSWIDLPIFDRKGRLRHRGGIVDCPGLYALGLPLMRRRKSSFIFGIEDDARDIAAHLSTYLRTRHQGDSHELHPYSGRIDCPG